MSLTKAQVARRQLGVALALYIENLDPISVHVLACGGGELAEQLAVKAKKRPLSSMWPSVEDARRHRALYWNAFKHATTKGGQGRADENLLDEFDDSHNDEALLVGWMDYFTAVGQWPIEAAVFQTWYMSWSFTSVDPNLPSISEIASQFPDWDKTQRVERKQRLRELIKIAKNDETCMNDLRNEQSPLALAGL
jgi:hypothetical protein